MPMSKLLVESSKHIWESRNPKITQNKKNSTGSGYSASNSFPPDAGRRGTRRRSEAGPTIARVSGKTGKLAALAGQTGDTEEADWMSTALPVGGLNFQGLGCG